MGIGLLVSGVMATAGGVLFIVAAAGELAPNRRPSNSEGVPSEGSDFGGLAELSLILGVLGTTAGLIMVPVGAVRLHRWRAWKRAQPIVNRTLPGTWTAGFSVRF